MVELILGLDNSCQWRETGSCMGVNRSVNNKLHLNVCHELHAGLPLRNQHCLGSLWLRLWRQCLGRPWRHVGTLLVIFLNDKVILRWKEELAKIGAAGGNSVRVWVHVEGDVSPLYNDDGSGTCFYFSLSHVFIRFVLGTDNAGTLVSDLTAFLDECAKNNIFMGLVLFNGAVLRNQDTINLFWDDSKLETYLDKALTPMVEGLRDHPALGFWEV